jgi:hypothetical protein
MGKLTVTRRRPLTGDRVFVLMPPASPLEDPPPSSAPHAAALQALNVITEDTPAEAQATDRDQAQHPGDQVSDYGRWGQRVSPR